MSPSWRESILVEVDAPSLRLRRLSAGLWPRVRTQQVTPLTAATPAAVAQALADAVAAMPVRGLRASVCLSGHWVRLALLTEARGLRGAAERQAAALHALRRIHGDAAAGWQITTCTAGPGSLVAAGADAALLDAIGNGLHEAGARLVRLQPALVKAFDASRHLLRRPAWLVCLEPGLATLIHADGRRLRSLRTHRLQQAPADELPRWLARAELLDGVGTAGAPVVIAHRGVSTEGLLAGCPGARLLSLDAEPAAPRASAADARAG